MFLVKNFPVGQRVLVDSSFGQPTTQGEARKEEATRQGELPLVKEVLLVALGSRQSRPYLLVSTDQHVPAPPCLLAPPQACMSRPPDDLTLPSGTCGPRVAHLRGFRPRLAARPGKPESSFQEGAVVTKGVQGRVGAGTWCS